MTPTVGFRVIVANFALAPPTESEDADPFCASRRSRPIVSRFGAMRPRSPVSQPAGIRATLATACQGIPGANSPTASAEAGQSSGAGQRPDDKARCSPRVGRLEYGRQSSEQQVAASSENRTAGSLDLSRPSLPGRVRPHESHSRHRYGVFGIHSLGMGQAPSDAPMPHL